MPREAHITAAYCHERAAKSRRAAAQQSGVGAHEASLEHALIACGHSIKAYEASRLAHEMSVQRTEFRPGAAK